MWPAPHPLPLLLTGCSLALWERVTQHNQLSFQGRAFPTTLYSADIIPLCFPLKPPHFPEDTRLLTGR